MTQITFYAPTFIDESMTRPAKGRPQRPTGKLSGMVFTRTFSKTRGGKIKAARGVKSFSWAKDTQGAKVDALAKAIEGMEELPGLEDNPPLNWIPKAIKERLI